MTLPDLAALVAELLRVSRLPVGHPDRAAAIARKRALLVARSDF